MRFTFPCSDTPETKELRQIEFEIAVDAGVSDETRSFPAYALYYVCEDSGGVCYYLRQDFTLSLRISKDAPTLR